MPNQLSRASGYRRVGHIGDGDLGVVFERWSSEVNLASLVPGLPAMII